MTKIPSVEERVEEFDKQFAFHTIERLMTEDELVMYKDDMENEDDIYTEAEPSDIHDYFRQALTADRTALLTELRDSGLLEEKVEHQDWCKLAGELEYSSCGCWKDHNDLAKAIKVHINNLINPTIV